MSEEPRVDGEAKESFHHRVGVVIVGAGESSRMGSVDKIFANLLGRPLITHTVEIFESYASVDQVVLVLPLSKVSVGQRLAQERGWHKVTSVCQGGPRRQDSVRLGLERLSACTWIAVHDGARPCLEPDILTQGLEAARESGAAVAGVPSKDTVKVVSSGGLVEATPPRERLWMVQTPQVFSYDLLLEAHRYCQEDVTDDAAMVEKLGHKVKVFTGSYSNIKVTTADDLAIAKALLRARLHPQGLQPKAKAGERGRRR